VGADSHDDAAVYRLDDERALVFTVDLITPIVDDPETFGRIAANNALSDVYAMGARPLMALNVSCFSPKLPPAAARAVLQGAQSCADEAGCLILGGHSVKDSEVKFGLAVLGEVHPEGVVRNDTPHPGDAIVLTKGLGTAALATAFKAGSFPEDDSRYQGLLEALTLSNQGAMEIALRHGVHAATDITGFGLVGHLSEVLGSSGLGARLEFDQIPALEGALEALGDGFLCGGAKSNAAFTQGWLRNVKKLPESHLALLQDPQTAGPLLLSVAPEVAEELVAELRANGNDKAQSIGKITDEIGEIVEVI
jgi:selenide, water dikinase